MRRLPNPKPCPFCGSTHVSFQVVQTLRYCSAICETCGALGPNGPSKKCAAAAWNRRADQPKGNTK